MSEFLAEASVLVRANTEAFRAQLLAEVTSAVSAASKIAVVPITPLIASGAGKAAADEIGVSAKQASNALAEEGAAAAAAGAQLQQLSARTGNITLSNRALSTAAEKLAAAETTVAGSADRVTAAQEATAAAQTAVNRAATSGVESQRILAGSALEAAVAFEKQAISSAKASAALSAKQSRDIAAANTALATSAEKFALAQTKVVGASSAAAEAQIVYNRASAATAAAVEALDVANRRGTVSQQIIARQALEAAAAFEKEALAANEAAIANERGAVAAAHHGIQLRNLGRGAGTAALAAIGLRGATLTANAAFIGGAAAAIGFGKALATAAKFESSLNVFKVTAGATADQMERIRIVARDLGTDLTLPGVNAQDAADALSGLARAGLSVQSSINGVRGVLQLATAAEISNEEAVTLVASALNAFNLSGKDAARVADLLAASSKESQGSISDVGAALQQSAAAAAQAGVSVQDTIALLTELGRAGLRGSDAGTSLRVALLRLIAPTKQAKEALDGLGVAIRDEAGNVRPEAFADITQALSGFTRAQRDATLALIFGQDAFRAASILGRDGAKGLNEMRDATQEVGVAAELAAARTQGLSGSFENLKNQASGLGLTIGQGLATPTSDFLNIVAGGFGNLNAFNDWISNVGEKTPRAEESIAKLADEFARLNKEAGGSGSLDAATQRVAELGRPAAIAVLDYAELTKELGRLSFAFESLKAQGASLETPGAKKLRADILELIQALNDTEPAGLKAASGIEEFRSGITATAIALERLKHAISPPEGFLPKAPVLPAQQPIPQEAQLEGAAAVASAKGNLGELLRIRNEQLDAAREEFRTTKETGDERVKLFKAMKDAEAAVISVQKQIATEQKQQQDAANRKREQDAAKAAKARKEADQAVLDSFSGKQNKLDLRAIQLGGSENLKAQLALQVAIANEASREIAIIDKTVKDQKTRDAAVAERVKTLATSGVTITSLLKQIGTKAKERAAAALSAVLDLDQARLQLAQLRLGPEGQGKDLVLAAFDKVIADSRKQRNATKKASLARAEAEVALQQFINERRDFLKGLEGDVKDTRGTTAFDLLKEFTDVFNQNAGNLINTNQPFAGPTGFTADIAQFLVRRPQAAKQTSGAAPVGGKVSLNDQELIAALDRLRISVEAAGGNRSTGKGVTGSVSRNRRTFFEAHQVREAIEARSSV